MSADLLKEMPWRSSMPARLRTFAFVCLASVATGCVRSSTHDRTLAQLAQEETRAERLSQELAQARAEAARVEARLQAELARTGEMLSAREQRLTQLGEELRQLENEVSRLSTLLNQRGDETALLRSRLESMSMLEQEIRERNRIYQEVIGRFQSLIDAGQLSVSISRGRMVINLPQDILFESGSATLGREGRATLTQVANVLADIPDRTFQVEGHTDDRPIATARFPSNWELSAGRALSVVHLLQEQGVRPENVSGAAYGEFQPVADNEDPTGRRLNRRIEIVMLPNLDVIAGAGVPPE
jgi:chemotaxis protein MotB